MRKGPPYEGSASGEARVQAGAQVWVLVWVLVLTRGWFGWVRVGSGGFRWVRVGSVLCLSLRFEC